MLLQHWYIPFRWSRKWFFVLYIVGCSSQWIVTLSHEYPPSHCFILHLWFHSSQWIVTLSHEYPPSHCFILHIWFHIRADIAYSPCAEAKCHGYHHCFGGYRLYASPSLGLFECRSVSCWMVHIILRRFCIWSKTVIYYVQFKNGTFYFQFLCIFITSSTSFLCSSPRKEHF
jgi:hypothetical protein